MSDRLSASDSAYLRDLLKRRAAIDLDASKQYLLEQRLEQLVRDAGFASVSHLVQQSRTGAPKVDTQIIEAMTTHETLFFRDLYPFEILRRTLLPALLAARARSRGLTIWSAACSSGQEPYSIAMLIMEHFPELAEWPVRIIATDISDKVLARAKQGRFQQIEVNRGLPAGLLLKYFDRQGMDWQIKPALRKLVEFRKLNLLDSWGALRPDVVFLRNVLIYFDVNDKRTILTRLRQEIAPDGALFLGTAETTLMVDDAWERISFEKASYYKVRP